VVGGKLITLCGGTVAVGLVVALTPGIAVAIDQTAKNGCSSPEIYSGALTFPPFDTPGGESIVRFQGWFEAESVSPESHDLAVAEYSLDGGQTWETGKRLIDDAPVNTGGSPDVGYSNNGTGQPPTFASYNFSIPGSQPGVLVRFHFDASDSIFNGFRGFAVDDFSADTASGQLTEGFEGGAPGWTFDAPSAAGPNVPFWHALASPAEFEIKSPEIDPDLITLQPPDSGALPGAPEGSSVAWFGDDATATFCGPDYANRLQIIPPPPPPPPPPPRTLANLPNPGLGTSVNVQQVGSGPVLVGVQGVAAGGRARASQKGVTFVPLTEARQVPVGSFLDTRRGTVRLQSARDRLGTRQQGDFSSGLFQVLQSRKRSARGLTTLTLKGASFSSCRRGRRGKRAQAAASLRRRLRANARGRFSTRGRHSAATVRGTIWLTADRCDGTLTRVTRGRVAVRDFRRRKTVIVRAGKSYLARAPR
jgi:hypothetical protein